MAKIKFDKVKKEEGKTYVESATLVMLVLLTVLSFVLAGFGFLVPTSLINSLLTNLLLVFLVAEGIVIIMLLYKILQK